MGGLQFPIRSAYDKRVRNQVKANALFRERGLHVVEPTFAENLAIADAFGNATTDAIVAFFGGEKVGTVVSAGSDASLRGKLSALLRR